MVCMCLRPIDCGCVSVDQACTEAYHLREIDDYSEEKKSGCGQATN